MKLQERGEKMAAMQVGAEPTCLCIELGHLADLPKDKVNSQKNFSWQEVQKPKCAQDTSKWKSKTVRPGAERKPESNPKKSEVKHQQLRQISPCSSSELTGVLKFLLLFINLVFVCFFYLHCYLFFLLPFFFAVYYFIFIFLFFKYKQYLFFIFSLF